VPKSNVGHERLLEQERLILSVTELIYEEMERAGVRKIDLAEALGTSKANITQALGGGQNLTLRTLADLAWAMKRQVRIAMPSLDGKEVVLSRLTCVAPPMVELMDPPVDQKAEALVA